MTWLLLSARTLCGGPPKAVFILSWFPIVPLVTNNAASLPVRSAMYFSRAMVVGSSAKTSSRRVQDWVAASMEAVGEVTVSPVDSVSVLAAWRGGVGEEAMGKLYF